MSGRWSRLVLVSLMAACVPSFEDRPWLVDRPRVLAVASSPAEVRPSEVLELGALVVTPDGPATDAVELGYCTRPRTAAERTSTTAACLEGDEIQSVGSMTTMLPDACARFGPNTPPTEGDRPAQRPADPDVTGGYHVPVRARVPSLDAEAFGRVRVRCDLVGATREIFEQFEDRYTDNVAPAIAALGPCDADEGSAPRVVVGGALPVCLRPEAAAAEPYVVYSERESRIIDARESLTVRWYVTAGALDRGRQTVELFAGDDVAPFEVEWIAPDEPGVVHLWAVLADARGGVTWAALSIDVEP